MLANHPSHANAAQIAVEWLANQHRKGWQVAFEKLLYTLMSEPELKTMKRLDVDTVQALEINLVEYLLAEGSIQARGELRRISDYLLSPAGPRLLPAQRDWLQQMGQRPLRLYDVTDVLPGVQLTLCDAIDPDAPAVVVQERAGSRHLAPGDQLGCRLMRVESHFELSGAVYSFSGLAGARLAEELRATEAEFGTSGLPGQPLSLRIMAAWVQQLVTPPVAPTLIDHYSGDTIKLINDHYRVLDWRQLGTALQACADVTGDRASGWTRHLACDDGQMRPIVSISLGKKPDQIEVFYNTERYAEQGRPWFEALAGSSVHLLTRKYNDADSIMAKATKTTQATQAARPVSRRAAAAAMPGIDTGQMTDIIDAAYRRFYADWADVPVPMLDHLTPRQACQSGPGQARVRGLIRSYEAHEKAQAAQQQRAAASFDYLWQSVGLSR